MKNTIANNPEIIYMTVEEVAEYTKRSTRTIRQLIADKAIKFYQTDGKGKILFKKHEVDQYIESGLNRTGSENTEIAANENLKRKTA